MHRTALACSLLLAACVEQAPEPTTTIATTQALAGLTVTRTQVVGDVYHYVFVLPVGDGPNAQLALHRVVRERAPWIPLRSRDAITLLHGDFASFATNFLPVAGTPASTNRGLATWLAQHGVDVCGIDRRWTRAPRLEPDFSDFDAMGLVQELDDTARALAFVRGVRLVSGATDRVTLAGFSRGGQIAYAYASREALLPALLRSVKGLVPLDVYASLAPEDEDLHAFYCESAAAEYAALADGMPEVDNFLQYTVGELALANPNARSPFRLGYDPALTNREAMLWFSTQSYKLFPATPVYHLAGGTAAADNRPTGLSFSSELDITSWLAGSTPWQSMRESADTDALLCGEGPPPADVPLSRIAIPVLSIAAAGGYGERAAHSTAQVSSTDVTDLLIRTLPVADEARDFGHADILFADAAQELAWQPLLAWLRAH